MIDNRKQFVTEALFLWVTLNKFIQQNLGYNCEYAREEILADSYVSVLIFMISSFKVTLQSEIIYC